MALDLAPHKIRVNTIAPTFIETAMTAPFFQDETFKSQVLSKIKLARLGQVEDLTGAILYLASEASSLVTGTSLVIDRSEEHTSELRSLMRISYAVFCLKKKNKNKKIHH